MTSGGTKFRIASAIVALGLLLAPAASGQGSDCSITGPLQLECGTVGTWTGSLPIAVFPYAANFTLINNNTGAAFVGPAGCPVVQPAGNCQVNVNVGSVGTFVLKLTLTTSAGAMPMCSLTITVVDTIPPVITCPPDVNVECGSSTAPAATGTPTAVDCSPVTFSHTDAAGATNCAGTAIIRTWIGTDSSGNPSQPCQQIITIVDTTPPSITCPAGVSVQCFSLVPAVNINSVITSDICGHPVVVTHVGDSPTNGTSSCNNVITRTYKATDSCGNMNTCTQTITVNDTTIPTITCPAGVSVQCFSLVPAPSTTSVIASDNCGGAVTVIHMGDSATNGTSSCNNVITRTYKATDLCGNMNTCTQTITVNDTTIPTITCPAGVSVQCFSLVPAPSTTSVIASDNCGGAVTVIHMGDSATNGTSSCNNVITRTYKATDVCGNMNTCTQTITVNDTTIPTITCPAAVSVQCFSLVPAPSTTSVIASDNCGGAVTVIHLSDVANNGTSSCNNVITRTYKATDACGNMNTCLQFITVNDTTAPTVTCPDGLSLQCFSQVPAPDVQSVTTTDNCGGPVTVTHMSDFATNGTSSCNNVITRTYRGEDPCGNATLCFQVFMVNDTTPPTLTCPPINVPCYSQIPPPSSVPATDNCGGTVTVTHVGDSAPSNGTSNCNNVITRTYQGVDECGNTSTCTQTITVNDTIPPVITYCPPNVTLPCGSNTTPYNPAVGYALASSDCVFIDCFSTNVVTGACPGLQIITRTWHATDSCGNTSSCVQIITLTPSVPSTCIPTTFTNMGGGCGNPAPALYTSLHTIANPMTLLFAGAPPNAPIVIGAQIGPFSAPSVVGSNCVLHVDPTAPATLLVEQLADANGMWSHEFPIWMTPALVNFDIRLQAGVLSAGLLNLTDAVGVRIGTCPPFCTYEPAEWSGGGLAGAVYDANWLTVFPSGLDLGIFNPGNGNMAPNGLHFTGDVAGRVALKQTMATLVGVASALPADETNPTSTSSGTLGTLTAALQLNIAFNAVGLLGNPSPSFGSLVYVNANDSLNGFTLVQILAVCNQVLAGQALPAGYTFDSLADLIEKLSVSYSNCTPSPWAATHLFLI